MAQLATVWSHKGAINQSQDWLQITAVMTADDATGAYAVEGIKDPGGNVLNLKGYWLHQIRYYYGTTGATDNSDLELLEHSSTGKDILLGAGTNIIDNATNNVIQPYLTGTTPGQVPVFGPLYVKITNNIVNSAGVTLVFNFVK